MANVLLIILLIISIIMTGLILIQQSEGGALGIGGGGGGGGGLMSGRSAANSVSRMTAILGVVFLVVALALSVVFNRTAIEQGLIDTVAEDIQTQENTDFSTSSMDDLLTDETDSVETTDPLADANVAAETEPTSDESSDETPAQPEETPENE